MFFGNVMIHYAHDCWDFVVHLHCNIYFRTDTIGKRKIQRITFTLRYISPLLFNKDGFCIKGATGIDKKLKK